MSINTLFALLGGMLLGGAVGLFAACVRYNKRSYISPGWLFMLHLGLAVCTGVGLSCMILSFEVRECPNCNIIVKSNYCEECGYQVRANDYLKELHCFECGADIDDETNFCPHCGIDVNQRLYK